MTPELGISLGLFSNLCILLAIWLKLCEIHSTLKKGAK